jgi:iron complex transport system substrate-binding protein
MRTLLILAFAAVCAHAAPQRVIGLGGDVTEIAFALGKGDAMAAVDLTSTYPDAAQRLPRVGYVRALSAEGILALRPNLVIASGDAGPPEALAQIRATGVPLVMLEKDHSLDGIPVKIRAVARALEADAEGAKLVASFEAERARLATEGGEPISAVFVMGRADGALVGAGRGTAADAMLAAAGLRNVFGGFEGYKPVSGEALLALAPKVIVTGTRTVQASGGLSRFVESPTLNATPAVKLGHVLVFDDMYLLGLGPRAAQAARELASAARK